MISDMRVANEQEHTYLEVPARSANHCARDSIRFSSPRMRNSRYLNHDRDHRRAWPARNTPIIARLPGGLHDSTHGVPGRTVFVRSDEGPAVDAILATGAIETTLETLDVLRVESGTPLFLVDMDEHTIPLEAGIEDRAISFTKGCYVGQEVIVRVTQRGHGRVAKKLVGLLLPKNSPAHPRDTLRAGDREIGRITSATWSPALECPIALGYAYRDFAIPGTSVEVATSVPATVTSLPFL